MCYLLSANSAWMRDEASPARASFAHAFVIRGVLTPQPRRCKTSPLAYCQMFFSCESVCCGCALCERTAADRQWSYKGYRHACMPQQARLCVPLRRQTGRRLTVRCCDAQPRATSPTPCRLRPRGTPRPPSWCPSLTGPASSTTPTRWCGRCRALQRNSRALGRSCMVSPPCVQDRVMPAVSGRGLWNTRCVG